MSRLVTIVALLDELLLFSAPVIIAFLLYIFGVIPLWIVVVLSAPFLVITAYIGIKVFKETPREYSYLGGRGVVVEDLKPEGVVKIEGVYWRAVCLSCEAAVGTCVELLDVKNGLAYVRPCQEM